MVRERMDGRTVKEETVECHATETSDEEPDGTLVRIRGERSRGIRNVGIGGRLWGAGRERVDESGRIRRGTSLRGRILEGPLAGVWECRLRSFEELGVLACTIENTLLPAGRDRCGGLLYVHSAPRSPFTHVVHGFFASHFWWGEVSFCVCWIRLEIFTTHFLVMTDHKRGREREIGSTLGFR